MTRALLLLLLLAGCAAAPRPLEGQFRIASLRGEALPDAPRPAEIMLLPGRFAATAGCNRITGSTEEAGTALRFGPGAATRMACPPPLDAREAAFLRALGEVRSVRRAGRDAVLLDGAGEEVMTLARR